MNDDSDRRRAVELLQQLGLKEYEAKCYVALARLPSGTAKEVSDISEVPRTRVYEAVRVLESKGLVEIQHSSPQQFRAVPIEEAAETLREEYQARTSALVQSIQAIEPEAAGPAEEVTHEVWALTGRSAIQSRSRELIDGAESEVVLVIGSTAVLEEQLFEQLRAAAGGGVDVLVGTRTPEIAAQVEDAVSAAEVFVSELPWLDSSPVDPGDDTTISRLLLVDGETILVSTLHESGRDSPGDEQAIFGRGFDNGIVAIARRLMGSGFLATGALEHDE